MELDLHHLRGNSEILQLFIYRNQNQHSRCTWWSSLCALKRNLMKLIGEVNRHEYIRVRSRCRTLVHFLLPKYYKRVTSQPKISVNINSSIGRLVKS